MIPESWTELTLRTSLYFLEEIGFQRQTYIEKVQLKRRRYCILYYEATAPRVYDGTTDMEVEWRGPCSEVIATVNIALALLAFDPWDRRRQSNSSVAARSAR